MREFAHLLRQVGQTPNSRTTGATTYGNVELPHQVDGEELVEAAEEAMEAFADENGYSTDTQYRRPRYLPGEGRQVQESTRLEARNRDGLRKLSEQYREGFFLDINHDHRYDQLGIDKIGGLGEVPDSEIDDFVDELYDRLEADER